MTNLSLTDIEGLLEKAGSPSWVYRPLEYDDWGTVRHSTPDSNGFRFPVAQASTCEVTDEVKSQFRARAFGENNERGDPVEGQARLIASAPTLARQLAATLRELEAVKAEREWVPIADIDDSLRDGHHVFLGWSIETGEWVVAPRCEYEDGSWYDRHGNELMAAGMYAYRSPLTPPPPIQPEGIET